MKILKPALCLNALSCGLMLFSLSAEARRIAPTPMPIAFQGTWVAERNGPQREQMCQEIRAQNSAQRVPHAYVQVGERTLYVHNQRTQAQFDGTNRYNPWRIQTATRLAGRLHSSYQPYDFEANHMLVSLDVDLRLLSPTHLYARGMKPRHYYRCSDRTDNVSTPMPTAPIE